MSLPFTKVAQCALLLALGLLASCAVAARVAHHPRDDFHNFGMDRIPLQHSADRPRQCEAVIDAAHAFTDGSASGPSDCTKCDEIFAELLDLCNKWVYLGKFIDDVSNALFGFCCSAPNYYCAQEFCRRLQPMCFITAGNFTHVDPGPVNPVPLTTCDNVPFREIAHTVTSYALNGSDMILKIDIVNPSPDGCTGHDFEVFR